MAKKQTFQQQLDQAKVILEKDYTSILKPADVYFLRLESALLDSALAMKMTLPAGDYIIIAQALLSLGGAASEAQPFSFQLSYRLGSQTVSDFQSFKLEPGAAPYNVLLHCALSADSSHAVHFSFYHVGAGPARVTAAKITALRVGSVKIGS